MNTTKKILIALLIAAALSLQGFAQERENPKNGPSGAGVVEKYNRVFPARLRVAYLEDPRFPSLTKEQLRQAMECASKAAKSEFMISTLDFGEIAVREIGPYFEAVLGKGYKPGNVLNPFAALNEDENPEMSPVQEEFLRQFNMDSLLAFVNEKQKPQVGTTKDFFNILYNTWREKAGLFANLKINDKPAFTPESYFFQSARAWKDLGLVQKEYDFFITNTAIFYDILEEPYPHTIFKHAKLGGTDLKSPGAPNGDGKAAMVSTIGFSNVAPFGEANLNEKEITEVLGVYLMLHEIAGHMILRMDDYYDHPAHCVMCTPPGNMDYAKATAEVLRNPGPCPICEKYILGFMAKRLRERKGGAQGRSDQQ